VKDGSEIHEATLTLFFLDRAGAETICMAPNMNQVEVINHLTNKSMDEKRNVLVESARIARGNIEDMKQVKAGDLDALIFPGGLGAASSLSSFATKGAGCTVIPEVERLIREMHEARKPMGFICIAPVIAAKVIRGVQLTIGNDKDTASAIERMGGKHIVRNVDEIAVDEQNRVVSAPAYMLGPTISKVALGIEKLVAKVLELARK
jgi:enhancing lycopene biosynthesis protein 2